MKQNGKAPAGHQELAKNAGFASWEAWCKVLEKNLGRTICGAKKRNGTEPCRQPPKANGRCRFHGGASPVGPAHPAWKTGEHSQLFPTLPERLRESAERAHADPQLISLRKQIAILQAREEELLGQLSTGESGEAWKRVGELVHFVSVALQSGEGDPDRAAVPQALGRLEELLAAGLGDKGLWREYMEVTETSRRMRDSEVNRLKALSSFVEAARVKAMMGRMIGIIRTRVTDPEVLRSIMDGIREEFARPAAGALPAGKGITVG